MSNTLLLASSCCLYLFMERVFLSATILFFTSSTFSSSSLSGFPSASSRFSFRKMASCFF